MLVVDEGKKSTKETDSERDNRNDASEDSEPKTGSDSQAGLNRRNAKADKMKLVNKVTVEELGLVVTFEVRGLDHDASEAHLLEAARRYRELVPGDYKDRGFFLKGKFGGAVVYAHCYQIQKN